MNERLAGVLETSGAVLAVAAAVATAVAPAFGWEACAGTLAALALVGVGGWGRVRRPPAWGAVTLLFAMSGVSLWVTQTPDATWPRTFQLWTGLGMFWALAAWARTRRRAAVLGAGLAGTGAGLALLSPFIVGWFTERKTFFPPSVYAAFPRLVSDTVHPNVMAAALLCAVFVAMALAFKPPKASGAGVFLGRLMGARSIWIGSTLVMLLVWFLTKSRGAYGAFLVGLIAFVLLAIRRRAVLGGAVLMVLVLAVGAGLWALQGAPMDTEAQSEILDTSTFAFRQQVWHYALMLVGDFPLTGVGMGGFNTASADLYGYSVFQHPGAHNLYLQVALDLGVPGLAAFLALVAGGLAEAARGLRRLRAKDDALWLLAVGAIAGTLALLAHGVIDLAVWGTRGALVLWGLLALLYALGDAAQPSGG